MSVALARAVTADQDPAYSGQNKFRPEESEENNMEMNSAQQLGSYRLVRYLAHGGMSDIYLARDESNQQLYALKLVKRESANNYRHFRREVSILSTLQHEHILSIVDYYEGEDGTAYYVTPYIEGGSLRERLADGPLSLEEASSILLQVGEALQFIHNLGLIHRDIKPANILLSEDNHVWLADFGLAKDANVPSDLTDSGCLIGTPHYLAPELLKEPASKSSDIYALGVVLYEMLTGIPPFTGQTLLAICWKHVDEQPPLPSALNLCISAAVEEVILRALAKQPEERFTSVREMAEAYQEALLSPTIVIRSREIIDQTVVPEAMTGEATIVRAKPRVRMLPVSALSQVPQKRPLTVTIALLAILFALNLGVLAAELQMHTPIAVNADAQMISAPAHISPAHSVTPSPTVKPDPTPTHSTRNGASRVNNQGNAPQQTGKPDDKPGQKHKKNHKHGKNGRDD